MKKNELKKTLLVLLFAHFFLSIPSWADILSTGEMANKEYDQGRYQEALDYYLQLLERGDVSGAIYYNLGNIYYRKGQLGEALFYFKMAEKLLPRNPDIKYNLQYLRKKRVDQIETDQNVLINFFKPFIQISLKESYYLLFFMSILLWPLLSFLLFKKTPVLKLLNWPIIFLYVSSLTIFITQFAGEEEGMGIVTGPTVKVYSAIGRDNVVLFSLHAGAEFQVEEIYDANWIRLSLNDGKKGWVRTQDVIIDKVLN